MKAYDFIVVGAGPAGIFACYEMTLLHPNANILLVDKGWLKAASCSSSSFGNRAKSYDFEIDL